MHRFSDQTVGTLASVPGIGATLPAWGVLLAGDRGRRGKHAAQFGAYISNQRYINGYNATFQCRDGNRTPIDVPAPFCAGTFDRCGAKRMRVETALAQLLRMIHRRALKLATLPDDERDPHYDLIRLSCCGAAELIGQSPDRAAVTANSMVEFTRAMVGIIETSRVLNAGRSDQWARSDSSTVWQPGRSQ
ncbi:hypothetical protein C8D77_103392 [Mesorhizobium loti]|uniref:Uncharacterized protein n=1 Tax=Rhizobium loti TaxID=381 RepID=A0A8E2WFK0_RHILI|nr:hypothetical protein C8D77_103392 [Mesorhizobium loti]